MTGLPAIEHGYPVPLSNPPGVGAPPGDDPLVAHLRMADPGESVRVLRDELARVQRAAAKAGYACRWAYSGYINGERAIRVWMVTVANMGTENHPPS